MEKSKITIPGSLSGSPETPPSEQSQDLLLELGGRNKELVEAKLTEIAEVKALHERLLSELRGMLAMVRPEGSTRFDTDTLSFYG